MGAILYFFGKYVAGVALTSDVEDGNLFAFNPITNFGFTEFKVTKALGGQVPGPVDHNLFVVVEDRRVSNVM